MGYITDKDKEDILSRTENKLVDIIGEFVQLHKSGLQLVGECPVCKAPRGLEVNAAKHIFKCFKCNGISGKTPIDYLMKGENYNFPDALKYLAGHIGYILTDTEPRTKIKNEPAKKKTGQKKEDSFCSRMLAASGLTDDDVMARVYKCDDEKSIFQCKTFKKGTVSNRYEIDLTGDDVIIEYYDLDGTPVMYDLKDAKGRPTGKRKEYFRIRWQFPEEHLDKNGKAGKYKTPYGAGTFIYIPERLRAMYKEKKKIDMLFIQEGEKKAEKACKHGIPSVAISGIQNIGQQGRLPEDLIRIIQTCQVREVCFLLDSDWNNISTDIKINDQVEKRPRNFFYAVRNFKDYCRSLKNRQLYVEIYFGHVSKNESDDKGVDDLLVNTLKGREEELRDDLYHLLNEKDLTGKYVQLYKITSVTDHRLEEYWSLNNPAKFAEAHKNILKDLPEFRIGKHTWKFDAEGDFVSAQPIESDEQYWEEEQKQDRSGNTYTVYSFNYARCFRFLQNRGFGRYRSGIDGTVSLIHLDPPTVRIVEPNDIRDFITDFTKSVASEKVLNMIYKGGPQYLGPDKLTNIDYIQPVFEKATRDKQLFYFKDTCWEVSAAGTTELDYTKIQQHIWEKTKKYFPAKKTGPLIRITRDANTKKFSYTVTELGKQCHFLQFLINTSNFTWRKEKLIQEQLQATGTTEIALTEEELYDNIEHLVSKMAAIGFMMMEGKDRSVSRAVVAMDGKQSEVGTSNGRSGKSIIGLMFQNVMQSFYINGKVKDIQADNFVWNDLVEGVKCAFIDDVRPNFDFEFLFANITGDWNVNYKGGGRATFPFPISPKIYLTTNHALNGDGSSFLDRQWLIAFSDFYNNVHKPIDDFGVLFFDEWDGEQWNLHWNLLAACIQTYLQFGVIESPGERLEVRRLRQEITEGFIMWGDEYFSAPEHINKRISRKELYDAFLEYSPEQKKWTTPTGFKKKFVKYCSFKGYLFNPHRYDPLTRLPIYLDKDGAADMDDKSAGVEWFTVGDESFWGNNAGSSSSTMDVLQGNASDKNELMF